MTNLHNPAQKLMLKYPRTSGALLFTLGVTVFYMMVILPMQKADEHASRVFISVKGSMVGIVLLVIGGTYLSFGSRFARIFQPSRVESKTPAYIAGIILCAIGLSVFLLLKSYIEAKGYVFSF
jgi:hypothetical protein